jgi:hypothetical protein
MGMPIGTHSIPPHCEKLDSYLYSHSFLNVYVDKGLFVIICGTISRRKSNKGNNLVFGETVLRFARSEYRPETYLGYKWVLDIQQLQTLCLQRIQECHFVIFAHSMRGNWYSRDGPKSINYSNKKQIFFVMLVYHNK